MPKLIAITDIDLCVLIGNLLDNALEACQNRNDKTEGFEFDHPFIRVYIGMKGKLMYISITNSAYGNRKKTGERFFSTKSGTAHGFGLLRVDKICTKYGGYCNRNSEPGAFSTEILIPALLD